MDTEMFRPYGKTERFRGFRAVVTEKIDGTNACVVILNGSIFAQSRNKIITPEDDNYGFAGWVERNKEELMKLGEGYHYGEWAGPGIQNNRHQLTAKTFFLFRPYQDLPSCCQVVPFLYEGDVTNIEVLDNILAELKNSRPYQPEGVIIYFSAFRLVQKYTYDNNLSKWQKEKVNE
jgi:hypothetical protein